MMRNSTSADPIAGKVVTGPVSARLTADGKDYINFFGSGYLALSRIPEIRLATLRKFEAGVPFCQQVPAALGAIDPIFDSVERAGAGSLGTEASVYIASGYLIGLVALAAIPQDIDLIAIDEQAHYNLVSAARASGIRTVTFTHCSADSLREVLKRAHVMRRPLVVTDGVFATTGRMAPLAEYATVISERDGRLLVDESHAFGVVGTEGRGASEQCGVESITNVGATLGKAFCAQGALVGCAISRVTELRLVPPIRGACAGSPLSAAAAHASLSYVAKHPELRVKVSETAMYLRTSLRRIGVDVLDSPAPIVSFQTGDREAMLELRRRAWKEGIYIYHSNYIGAGAAGTIRCAVFADHSREDIDALISAIASAS